MIFEEPLIKVGILSHSVISFELKGAFRHHNQNIDTGTYNAEVINNKITTTFNTSKSIILTPNNGSTFIVKQVRIGIDFHWEKNEDQEFNGIIELKINNGKVLLINHVHLEQYLQSVISSEMSAMSDINLLKAHAIVSRSWLVAQILAPTIKTTKEQINKPNERIIWYDREDHKLFDVCADDHCQRYQGLTKVVSQNVKKAITETRGVFLMYNNEVCDARFSKCCGGLTESFENVWQPTHVPYLCSISDTEHNQKIKDNNPETFILSNPKCFCNTENEDVLSQVLNDYDQTTKNFFRWKVEYTQSELSGLLKQKAGIDFGEIINLVPIERGDSGRINKLKIIGSKNTITIGKELEIRKWLSTSHLYSSAFVIEMNQKSNSEYPDTFILKGAGWGHGVGMCQIGAAVMSMEGKSTEEILQHYFLRAQIVKKY